MEAKNKELSEKNLALQQESAKLGRERALETRKPKYQGQYTEYCGYAGGEIENEIEAKKYYSESRFQELEEEQNAKVAEAKACTEAIAENKQTSDAAWQNVQNQAMYNGIPLSAIPSREEAVSKYNAAAAAEQNAANVAAECEKGIKKLEQEINEAQEAFDNIGYTPEEIPEILSQENLDKAQSKYSLGSGNQNNTQLMDLRALPGGANFRGSGASSKTINLLNSMRRKKYELLQFFLYE